MANDPIKLVDVGALDRFKTDIENEIPDSVQYNTIPIASADWVGKIVQYTGATTGTYTNGFFYKCVRDTSADPATYKWQQWDTQPESVIATEYDVGITKPDNLTIFVDSTGTIRTKVWAGTQAEYDQQRYRIPNDTTIIIADSIVPPQGDTYVNGIKIVPWGLGTDEDVAAMMQGHYDGKINIYDYWSVGDVRSVHLTATESNVKSLPPAYGDIEATLINKGYGNNDVAFAVSLFSPSHGWIFDDWSGCESWDNTKVKDWFSTLYNALPVTIRSMFKPFDYVCATRYDSNTTTTYNDYFTFFTEKEIYGSRVYSNAAEANALQQIPWFTEKSHRVFFDESTVPTFTVMPEPSEEYVGKTYRYIGETTAEYTQNYYYMCTKTSNSYEWSRVTHSYYWTRSIGTAADKIVAYSRDNDSPYSVNTMGGGWLYVPFGCI